MYPCAHGELGDEDIAAFREQDWGFCRYHFHVRICFHDLLDACQWQLVYFVIMVLVLKLVDSLLPVGGQNVTIRTIEALANL